MPDDAGGPADGEVDVWILDLDRPDSDSGDAIARRTKAGTTLGKSTRSVSVQNGTPVGKANPWTISQAGSRLLSYSNPTRRENPLEGRTDRSCRISFNLAHSGRYGLLAVGSNREVGVDIEIERALDDLVGMARQIMSAVEWQSFQSIPSVLAQGVFFSLWTRKEALLKAIGTGFLTDPRNLDLGLANGATAPIAFQGTVWSVEPLTICAPTKAAIAIEGVSARIRIFGPEAEQSKPSC